MPMHVPPTIEPEDVPINAPLNHERAKHGRERLPPYQDESRAQQSTMVLDCDGILICVGDTVFRRLPTQDTGPDKYHGAWIAYTVIQAPGGFLLSYSFSDTGQCFPVSYAGELLTSMLGEDGHTHEAFMSLVPVRCSLLSLVHPDNRPVSGSGA